MKKCFLIVAMSVFLFSCADIERDNPYDMLASNYIPEDISKEGSSSSVEAGEPSSSSGNEEPSSSSAGVSSSGEEALSSSSAETGGELSSSSSTAESSSSSAGVSSSVETGNNSSSSSDEKPSSSSGTPEPTTVGTLSFTNADYTEDDKKYYYLGTKPEVKKDLAILNRTSANCDGDIRYEQSPETWNINSPGKIRICAKAICNEDSKTLECAEAELVPNLSVNGTCNWTETGESPVVAPEDIVPQIDISIQNNYGRCEEDIYLSSDGATIWTPPSSWSWQAETANLLSTGIKAYVKCNENLTGGIACPKIKIKNPKATGYIIDDRDGQIYQTVEIDEQTWFAENLNHNQNNNQGNCYDNLDINCVIYGAFMSGCPDSWHLPTSEEWTTLINYIGGTTEGKKLKAASGWNNNGNGTDDYGFAALPGGYKVTTNSYPPQSPNYVNIGRSGYWSTSSYSGGTTLTQINYYIGESGDVISSAQRNDYAAYTYSVRCLKN